MRDWESEIDKLTYEMSGLLSRIDTLEVNSIQSLQSLTINVETPAANQIRNGDLFDSVNSRFDETVTSDDRSKECAYWHSHDAPYSGQQLSDAFEPTTPNNALKSSDHSGFNSSYCKWDKQKGYAYLNGDKTLDAPLPINSANAGRTFEVCFIAARRHKYIEIPENLRILAGVWDNTSGQRDWLGDAFTMTAQVIGTPVGTVERRYRVFVETDKGVSYLSDEITVANAPNDISFPNSNVLLKWKAVEGVLRYIVYRYTPSTGTYLKLEEVSNGTTTYIDLNTNIGVVGGYPSATFDTRKAVYYTNTGELTVLATDGVSAQWDTISFPIIIPNDYHQENTTDKQWVRIGQTQACNLFLPQVAIDNTGSLVSYVGDYFDAEYNALYAGLTVQIYDANDNLLATGTVSSRYNSSVLLTNITSLNAGNLKARIVGGGFHGIVLDLVHACYQKGTQFALHSDDEISRKLPPTSTPNGSNQGGTGTSGGGIVIGGDDGTGGDTGGIRCVVLDTPIKLPNQNISLPSRAITEKMQIASGNLRPNMVNKVLPGFDYVREVYAANGAYQRCTDSHKFLIAETDIKGTPLSRIRVGDLVLTENDGKKEMSKIVYISPRSSEKEPVRTFSLIGGQTYLSGEFKPYNFSGKLRRLIDRYLKPWKKNNNKNVFFFSHNRKDEREFIYDFSV